MEAREELLAKRAALMEDYGNVQTWFFFYFIMFFILVGVAVIATIVIQRNDGTEPPEAVYFWLLILSATLTGVALWGMTTLWHAHYHLIWRHLKHGRMAEVVIEKAYWDIVMDGAERSFLVKFTGFARPVKLLNQLELAGDYWVAAVVMSRAMDEAAVRRAARWGNATRLCNNIISGMCGSGCSILLIIGFSAILIPLFWLFLPMLFFYIKQQATVAALVDFYVDKPRIRLSRLKPLD